jgi:hypothetical protein
MAMTTSSSINVKPRRAEFSEVAGVARGPWKLEFMTRQPNPSLSSEWWKATNPPGRLEFRHAALWSRGKYTLRRVVRQRRAGEMRHGVGAGTRDNQEEAFAPLLEALRSPARRRVV